MNFPNLETCKAISDEFPESEYVWIDAPEAKETIRAILGLPRTEQRSKVGIAFMILANAPICEELGEWLKQLPMKDFEPIVIQCLLGDRRTETQARAEAIKLILENQK